MAWKKFKYHTKKTVPIGFGFSTTTKLKEHTAYRPSVGAVLLIIGLIFLVIIMLFTGSHTVYQTINFVSDTVSTVSSIANSALSLFGINFSPSSPSFGPSQYGLDSPSITINDLPSYSLVEGSYIDLVSDLFRFNIRWYDYKNSTLANKVYVSPENLWTNEQFASSISSFSYNLFESTSFSIYSSAYDIVYAYQLVFKEGIEYPYLSSLSGTTWYIRCQSEPNFNYNFSDNSAVMPCMFMGEYQYAVKTVYAPSSDLTWWQKFIAPKKSFEYYSTTEWHGNNSVEKYLRGEFVLSNKLFDKGAVWT